MGPVCVSREAKSDGQDYSPNKIQQIDSLNAVALYDTGYLVRTTDGGNSWVKQNLPYSSNDFDVNFSDSMTGIVLSGDPDSNIMTTSDGGTDWIRSPFQPIYFQPIPAATLCHSYGDGKFMVCDFGGVTIFQTSDNWETFDSLPPISPWTDDSDVIGFGEWQFYGTDTIVAFGAAGLGALITISTDGGQNWTRSNVPNSIVWDLQSMSALDRNIVFCSGTSEFPHILSSTNHGVTWAIDTFAFDTSGYLPQLINGVTVTPNGHAVALLTTSMIALGIPATDGVSVPVSSNQVLFVFPNPASQTITFSLLEEGKEAIVTDILGREVWHGTVLTSGSLTLDVSTLPPGLYHITDGTSRAKFVKE